VSGYTPVFDTVFQGTLCGKYPDLPVWLVLLALQQRGGIIDAHPSYIATISGLPQADIEAAIKRFCDPDPASRTADHDGRRLEPIEGAGFGWRVLNHRKYQEKARKSAFDALRVADGRNAERMATRAHPRTPAHTRAHPPSDSNTNKEKIRGADAPPPFDLDSIHGLDREAWGLWIEHRKAIRKPIKPHAVKVAASQLARLGKDQRNEVDRAIAGGWTGLHPDGGIPAKSKGDRFANAV
jgi:hypothetical protein